MIPHVWGPPALTNRYVTAKVIVSDPVWPSLVALTCVGPSLAPTAVTNPVLSTLATKVSRLRQLKTAAATKYPFASAARALIRAVSPGDKESVSGITVMVATTWATVTVRVAT